MALPHRMGLHIKHRTERRLIGFDVPYVQARGQNVAVKMHHTTFTGEY